MKPLLAFIGGFVVSLGIFGTGAMVAIGFLSARPVVKQAPSQNIAALWSRAPQQVDPAAQNLKRVAGVADGSADQPRAENLVAYTGQTAADSVDAVTTASTDAGQGMPKGVDPIITCATGQAAGDCGASKQDQTLAAHIAWCTDHYRSYRQNDNTYQPYGGGARQPCVSPYSDQLQGRSQSPGSAETQVAASGQQVQVVPASARAPAPVQAISDDPAGSAGSGAAAPVAMTLQHVQDCFDRYRSYRPEDNTFQPFGGGARQQCQ